LFGYPPISVGASFSGQLLLEWWHFTFSRCSAMTPECQLFGTLSCHLCELAEAEVMPLVNHGLQVELIDIADNASLYDRYSLMIPVLRRVDTGAELAWPFDTEQVVAFVR